MKQIVILLIILAFGLFSCANRENKLNHSGFTEYTYSPLAPKKFDPYWHFKVKGITYDIPRPGQVYENHMIIHWSPGQLQTLMGTISAQPDRVIFKAQNGKTFTFKLN